MDGIQRSKSFINLIPPLPILEVPINTLGYGFKGRNWVATLLEVPDDVPPQQIAAVCPPPNLPVTPPTPNQVGPACSKRGTWARAHARGAGLSRTPQNTATCPG